MAAESEGSDMDFWCALQVAAAAMRLMWLAKREPGPGLSASWQSQAEGYTSELATRSDREASRVTRRISAQSTSLCFLPWTGRR